MTVSQSPENTRFVASTGNRKLSPWDAVAFFLLCTFAFFTYGTIKNTSATFDETVRIPAAAMYAQDRDAQLDPVGTMPLVMRLHGAALSGMAPVVPVMNSRNRGIWRYGWFFMMANRDKYLDMVRRTRLTVLICGVALCLVVFLWARRLYGPAGGALATAVLCLDPNIIAHSAVAGVDIPLALFCAVSWFLWQHWAENGRLRFALFSGVFLGLALLTKIFAVVLVPVMLIAAVLRVIVTWKQKGARSSLAAGALALAVCLAAALAVFNTESGWRDVGKPASSFQFQSGLLKSISEHAPDSTPAPLPARFVRDLDVALMNTRVTQDDSDTSGLLCYYLNGEKSWNGWPHYFLAAWGMKEPVGAMLLLALGVLAGLGAGWRLRTLLCALPAVAILLTLSTVLKLDFGFRHALPALPFAAVLAGGAVRLHRRFAMPAAALLVLWMLVACVRIHPNHLAYFNEPAGGPANGYKHLLDSNVDWGQNLPALARYQKENNIDRLYLAHFGIIDASLYGVRYFAPPCVPHPGVYAISPNFYYDIFPKYRGCFEHLQGRPPDDIVAHTYYIYKVEENSRPRRPH